MTEAPQVTGDAAVPSEPAAAVAHWRGLAAGHPGQFERQLATSLVACAHSQAASGDMVGAAATGREALDLWRHLDAASPTFEPQLGTILFAVSVYSSQLGDVEGARALAEDAVRFWRRASAVDPGRRLRLAEALQLLSARYRQAKMWRQSLVAEREAIAIKRDLLAPGTGAADATFAKDLDKFVRRLIDIGETDEAIAMAREAADQWRRLAARDPDGSGAGHAAALKQLGSLLAERPITAPEQAQAARPILKQAREIQTARAFRWLGRTLKLPRNGLWK